MEYQSVELCIQDLDHRYFHFKQGNPGYPRQTEKALRRRHREWTSSICQMNLKVSKKLPSFPTVTDYFTLKRHKEIRVCLRLSPFNLKNSLVFQILQISLKEIIGSWLPCYRKLWNNGFSWTLQVVLALLTRLTKKEYVNFVHCAFKILWWVHLSVYEIINFP